MHYRLNTTYVFRSWYHEKDFFCTVRVHMIPTSELSIVGGMRRWFSLRWSLRCGYVREVLSDWQQCNLGSECLESDSLHIWIFQILGRVGFSDFGAAVDRHIEVPPTS